MWGAAANMSGTASPPFGYAAYCHQISVKRDVFISRALIHPATNTFTCSIIHPQTPF